MYIQSHYTFPSDFRFGIADADLQVISEALTHNAEASQPSMWTEFARSSGRVHENQTPERSVDRYSRWQEDLDLIAALGVKHYRTSVSMARLLHSDGSVNAAALAWYRRYFEALRERGISVYATLYHWELPQSLSERGGWRNRDTVDVFTAHVVAAARELGDLVDEFIILNEPWCVAFLSYHRGMHAPGETSLRAGLEAAHHVLLAIGAGYSALHAALPSARISSCFNTQFSYAASDSLADRQAAHRADGYFNRWFLDPIFTGRYPEDMSEFFGSALPRFGSSDMQQINVGARLHALCINNYCGEIVAAAPNELGYRARKIPGAPENDLGWPIFSPPWYSAGLYDMLLQVHHSYRLLGLKRLYVTENGMALSSPWDGQSTVVNDPARIAYYQLHLSQIAAAIKARVPVEAFFAWTLLDNYEWAEGYRPESCFGLVHVDRATLQRVPKTSYHWYRALLKQRGFVWEDKYSFTSPELRVRRTTNADQEQPVNGTQNPPPTPASDAAADQYIHHDGSNPQARPASLLPPTPPK